MTRCWRFDEPRVIAEIELIADLDGTFGARWEGPGESVGATWDHASLDSVLTEIYYAIDPPR